MRNIDHNELRRAGLVMWDVFDLPARYPLITRSLPARYPLTAGVTPALPRRYPRVFGCGVYYEIERD